MHRFRQFSITISIYILGMGFQSHAAAQSMQMNHHEMISRSKNIFLCIMDTMMTNMESCHTYSSSSEAFLKEMIPHHEGAISMAKIEIQNGKNFEMIQLAKSIQAEQISEVVQMQYWLKELPMPAATDTTGFHSAMNKTMILMMRNMPPDQGLNDTDRAFAAVMIPHHQAAIDMAKVLLKYSPDTVITAFARQLISNEQVEIDQMHHFIRL